jgi:hypothetical protein
MRKGQNPAKFVGEVARPERITVAVLAYIPFLSGFYAQTLEVLKLCLESLRNAPGLPFDLLVFDNGSCKETRDYLLAEQDGGRIQYLLLSRTNVGKGGAWNAILGGAPGEIISYCDSDVLFSPKWLGRSVDILESFPNVGMVTARPFRTPPELYDTTLAWAEKNAKLEAGQFISWDDFLEFNLSLGQTEAENRKTYSETKDWKITYKGLTAMVGASHWQFTAYKSRLRSFLPFTMDTPMGQVRQLDRKVNESGLLRLMVPEPLAMNMSNTVPLDAKRTSGSRMPAGARRRRGLLDWKPIRRILLGVHNAIFRRYYA